jgi:hypothetical protein
MNSRALTFKRCILHLLFLFAAIGASFNSYSQSIQTYYIEGTVINSMQLKAMPIELQTKDEHILSKGHSDSLGRFKFGDLTSGRYKLVNKHYGLDTVLIIQDRSVEDFTILLNVCEVDAQQAKQDILNGKPRLLLIGGIAPIYYKGQEVFERKYKVSYNEYGCTPPDEKCVKAYNKVIFAYLDKQYGRKWRKAVRKDVIGYK